MTAPQWTLKDRLFNLSKKKKKKKKNPTRVCFDSCVSPLGLANVHV